MISYPTGTGYLGGDPPYVIIAGGVPFSCQVDLYYQSELAATTHTLDDGSWRFSNLDTSSIFDVVARGAPLLEDSISSRRTPFAMQVIVDGGPLIDLGTNPSGSTSYAITGTAGPYSASVVSGSNPGLTISINGNNLTISGSATGVGTHKFKVKVASSVATDYCLVDVIVTVT